MNKIGFIGTGLMGLPMAKNLQKKYMLNVFNRTKENASELINSGAIWINTAKQLAEESEIVILMLSNDEVCENVLTDVFQSLNKPLIINMSTVSKDQSIKLHSKAEHAGFKYLEAPVAGSTGPARNATLKILVGGNEANYLEVKNILLTMGDQIFYAGKIGKASILKLLINTNLAVQMGILAETMALAKKLDMDADLVLNAFNNTAVTTIVSKLKGPKILKNDFSVAFPYEHMLKDIVYTSELHKDLPITNATIASYRQGIDELAREDFSAIYKKYMEL